VNRGRSFCSDTAAPPVKMSVEAAEARLTRWGRDDRLATLPVFTLMSSSPDVDSLRLTVADFDAFLPDRATSNAYTRPRLELKQRMLAWAKGVVTRLAEIEIPVDVSASDEHPSLRNGRRVDCQRVFFWRDAAGRAEIERLIDRKRSLAASLGDPSPHPRHAFLALRVDAQKVEVSVELHPDAWVDCRNLRALLGDPARTLALTSALEALPDQFTLGLAGETERTPAAGVTSDSIRALALRSEQDAKSLWIGWTIPRDVAVTHAELLVDQLEDAIVALGPIAKIIAWAPDNDLIDLGSEVEAAKADRARAHEEAERDRAQWQARRERVEQEQRERGRERAARVSDGTPAPSAARTEPEESARREAAAGEPRRHEPLARPRPLPRVLPRRPLVTEVDPTAPIEKGTRVQVLAGPFRGKVGVVQELDGKGVARVMLGLLATRVEVTDLMAAAEGKERPALASSHRKPMGVRS
jgi:transcription antitermination factor NusG